MFYFYKQFHRNLNLVNYVNKKVKLTKSNNFLNSFSQEYILLKLSSILLRWEEGKGISMTSRKCDCFIFEQFLRAFYHQNVSGKMQSFSLLSWFYYKITLYVVMEIKTKPCSHTFLSALVSISSPSPGSQHLAHAPLGCSVLLFTALTPILPSRMSPPLQHPSLHSRALCPNRAPVSLTAPQLPPRTSTSPVALPTESPAALRVWLQGLSDFVSSYRLFFHLTQQPTPLATSWKWSPLAGVILATCN